jgi:hypothetical protein
MKINKSEFIKFNNTIKNWINLCESTFLTDDDKVEKDYENAEEINRDYATSRAQNFINKFYLSDKAYDYRILTKSLSDKERQLVTHIDIPEGVQMLTEEHDKKVLKKYFPNVKSITLPKSLKVIGEYTFGSLENLEYVDLSNTSVKQIGAGAFSWCKKLNNVYLPDTVTTIHWNAFAHCINLSKIRLSPNIDKLDEYTFCDCNFSKLDLSNLKNVRIIGKLCFGFNHRLRSIILPPNLVKIEEMSFFRSNKLAEVVFPDSLKYIGKEAFRYVENLKSIKLPQNLKVIGKHAFTNTRLEGIVEIPDSVYEVGFQAFAGCKNLKEIKFGKNVKFLGDNSFVSDDSLEKIYVSKDTELSPDCLTKKGNQPELIRYD